MTLYMPLFRSCTSLTSLSLLHAHLLISGLHRDTLASTKLIQAYSHFSNLPSAQLVFNTFPSPDSFMWGVLINSYVSNLFFTQAISLYHQMLSTQPVVSSFVYPSLLRACSSLGDVTLGGNLHGRITKNGLEFDGFVQTALIGMYAAFGNLVCARRVFGDMPVRDVVTWSSMILSYVRNELVYDGLDMFRQMVLEGVEVDPVTMLGVTEACSKIGDGKLAKVVHGFSVRRGIASNGLLENSVIVMYSKCGNLYSAERLFKSVSCASTDSWTAMISCYNHRGCFREALGVYVKMQEHNVEPNSVTVVTVLLACSQLDWLREGRSVHGFVVRSGIDPGFDLVGPALIEMYSNCGKIKDCERVFDSIQERKLVSWNSLITVYAQNGFSDDALRLLVKMLREGLLPDSFTLASSLSACAKINSFELGCLIHGHTVKTGFVCNEFVQNSLIDMYSKCGSVDMAYMIFNSVKCKSTITWNSMVSGFVNSGNSFQAISLLDQMHYKGLELDKVSYLSAIQACCHSGFLEKGKWFHHKVIINGVEKDSYLGTALIDMYAKCGELDMAQRVFDYMVEKSVVTWSAMIAGYGLHGHIKAVISLFSQMVDLGIKPNEVTFMSILSSCSHTGFVEEGKFYFSLMMNEFGTEPKLEHYICMVDLLSRAGDLDGALEFIKSRPIPASASIWGAVLNGCRIHGRMDMIESVRRNILHIEPDNSGYYISLSNIYAEEGNWDEFRKLRSKMNDIGLKKVPGYCTIVISRQMYRFIAGDTSNSQTKEIYRFLEDLEHLAREQGCMLESKFSTHGTDGNVHSEKLAIAFGIMNTSPGTKLQISKNLRVCTDCHTFTKFVSRMTNRDVIMRDSNRFHHFSNGKCSCGDFW